MQTETLTWRAHAHVDKFTQEQVDACKLYLHLDREPTGDELLSVCAPDAVADSAGNLLVNTGIQRLEDLLIGVAVQSLDNTHTRLGVGDGTSSAAAGDTDLSGAAGSTHRQFVVMDSTYPSRSSQTLTFRATHTTGLSNFHWQEWGIDFSSSAASNGTTVNTLFNHKVTDLGTKTSAASWVFSVTVVIS